MELYKIILGANIEQIYVSHSLINHTKTIFKDYNTTYVNQNKTTLFWGMYIDKDIKTCIDHIGPMYVYWHYNDADIKFNKRLKNIMLIKKLKIVKHFCSSDKVATITYPISPFTSRASDALIGIRIVSLGSSEINLSSSLINDQVSGTFIPN